MHSTITGFIGLGSLGTAIAANLAEKGRLQFVYNRSAEKTLPFTQQGVKACSSVKELAMACDIVISIVSDDQAVQSITEGRGGIAANLKAGGIHISMTTILPATADALHVLHGNSGSFYVASPVLGRPEAARARKLNFCLAGPAAVKELVKPLLSDAGGVQCWDYGEKPGNANTAKLCTNFLLIAAIEGMAESLDLAEKSGIDKRTVMGMLSSTLFNCPIYINYGNTILEEKFLPAGFSLQLALKDVKLVHEQASAVNSHMPFADTLKDKMSRYVGKGLGGHDVAALAMPEK